MSSLFRRASVVAALASALSLTLLTPADAATKPARVTTVKVTSTPTTATVKWAAAKNATKYRVCLLTRADAPRCTFLSKKLTGRTTTFRGLTSRAGTDYFVRVYSYRTKYRAQSALTSVELAAPAVPAGVTSTVGTSSLKVAWKPSAGAQKYAVCLMTYVSTETCWRTSTPSTATTATFTGLAPTSGADYYYRVIAYGATNSSRSAKYRVDLPVGPVESLTAAKTASGSLTLTWSAATNAEAYEIQFATNEWLSKNLATYTVTGTTATVRRLAQGRTYYFRVRGTNAVAGAFTAIGSLRLATDPAVVSVLTFNLCGQDKCVTAANGMKKWSVRKPLAGALARLSASGIIATQESHDKDTKFVTELPGYQVASYYSSKTLLYDPAKYDKLASDKMTLDADRKKYAVWATFRDRTSGTEFIVVDAHLQPSKGKTNDDLRAAQTAKLLSKVRAINPDDLPVVYAGDFNSNKSNATQSKYPGGYDAPRQVFANAGVVDSIDTAARAVYSQWNSANQAKVSPPYKNGDHVDHIYVDPEIAVHEWRVLLSLEDGQYTTPFASDHNPVRAVLIVPGR